MTQWHTTGALNLRGIAYFFATSNQRAGAMLSLVGLACVPKPSQLDARANAV